MSNDYFVIKGKQTTDHDKCNKLRGIVKNLTKNKHEKNHKLNRARVASYLYRRRIPKIALKAVKSHIITTDTATAIQ